MLIKNPHRSYLLPGFTLLEVMIVMLIMAIITGVAMLSLHLFSHARQVTIKARELRQTLFIAEHEALLRPCVLGLRFSQKGYQFYEYISDNTQTPHWQKLVDDKLSQPNAFNHFIKVHLLNSEKLNSSYIVFSANGTVSPFTLIITDENHERTYLLKVTQNGVIKLHQQS